MKKPESLSKPEIITHAAVLTIHGYPLLGKCHADCFHQGANTGIEMSGKAEDQGFMTSHGRYVNRQNAFEIAASAGQIKDVKGGYLISEDLWSPRSGGQFAYDSVKGYFNENFPSKS